MYETSDLEKGTLRQLVKAVGRSWVKEFQADGMACAKAQGTSVTPARREGEGRWSTAPGSWEPRRSWGRTDLCLSASGRRVVIEAGTEEPILGVDQKRELKGQ